MCPLTQQWNHWGPAWMGGVSLGVTHEVSSSLPPLSSLLCKCLSCLCNSPSTAAFTMGCLDRTKMSEGCFPLPNRQSRKLRPNSWVPGTAGMGKTCRALLFQVLFTRTVKQRLRTLVLTLLQEWWRLAGRWREAEGKNFSQWIVRWTWTKGLNEKKSPQVSLHLLD